MQNGKIERDQEVLSARDSVHLMSRAVADSSPYASTRRIGCVRVEFVICHVRDSRQILFAAGLAASSLTSSVRCYNEIAIGYGTCGVHMACSNLDYRNTVIAIFFWSAAKRNSNGERARPKASGAESMHDKCRSLP